MLILQKIFREYIAEIYSVLQEYTNTPEDILEKYPNVEKIFREYIAEIYSDNPTEVC